MSAKVQAFEEEVITTQALPAYRTSEDQSLVTVSDQGLISVINHQLEQKPIS